jgi:hypothetical protein
LLPQELPAGVTADKPYITRSSLCPQNVHEVTLGYRGPGYRFYLVETYSPTVLANPTPVRVNGVLGKKNAARNYGDGLIISWQQGNVGITATTVLNENFTEEHFLEVLDSMPDP